MIDRPDLSDAGCLRGWLAFYILSATISFTLWRTPQGDAREARPGAPVTSPPKLERATRSGLRRRHSQLATVLSGGETEEAKTHWWVYRAMSTTVHDPIFKRIDFEMDIERRTARVSIPSVLESTGRPIISPATGEQHRVRIDIPNGIEFEIAEIGSASTKATGLIRLDLDDSYGQFNIVHHSGTGVVHTRS